MELAGATYQGPPANPEALEGFPESLKQLLTQVNGFVAFHGGLHIRGVGEGLPSWHRLDTVWTGSHALSKLFPAVRPSDVPFGEDGMGNQFFLRQGAVWRLSGETGKNRPVGGTPLAFLANARKHPLDLLSMHPLVYFQHEEGGQIHPDELLLAFPPLCTEEAGDGVELRPVPRLHGLEVLSEIAREFQHRTGQAR